MSLKKEENRLIPKEFKLMFENKLILTFVKTVNQINDYIFILRFM